MKDFLKLVGFGLVVLLVLKAYSFAHGLLFGSLQNTTPGTVSAVPTQAVGSSTATGAHLGILHLVHPEVLVILALFALMIYAAIYFLKSQPKVQTFKYYEVILTDELTHSATQIVAFLNALSGYMKDKNTAFRWVISVPQAGEEASFYLGAPAQCDVSGLETIIPGIIFSDVDAFTAPTFPVTGASLRTYHHGGLQPLKGVDNSDTSLDVVISALATTGGVFTMDMLPHSAQAVLHQIHRHQDHADRKKGKSKSKSGMGASHTMMLKNLAEKHTPGVEFFRTQIRIWGDTTGSVANAVVSATSYHNQLVFQNLSRQAFNLVYPLQLIVLNAGELSNLVRIPTMKAASWDLVAHSRYKYLPAPKSALVPSSGSIRIGLASHPGQRSKPIYVPLRQFMNHTFLVGKTGSGKGVTIKNMILSMLANLEAAPDTAPGFTYIDPHGDDAEDILGYIPKSLEHRVHVLNLNQFFPRAFNLIEGNPEFFKSVIKDIWDSGTANTVRMSNFISHALNVLAYVQDATLLHIELLFSDDAFRQRALALVTDPVELSFWQNEFAGQQKNMADIIQPIRNRLSPFISNIPLRLLIGQPRSTIIPARIMDEGHILIVNLGIPKAREGDADSAAPPGEDAKTLLGATLLTRFHAAALARGSVEKELRRPHIVIGDEIHVYATNIMSSILSEDRKYGLGLVLATQYLDHIPKEILSGILGNVGTVAALELGTSDAATIIKYFPSLRTEDIVGLPERNAVVYTKIGEGEEKNSFRFSIYNPYPPQPNTAIMHKILEQSDRVDGTPVAEAEKIVNAAFQLSPSSQARNIVSDQFIIAPPDSVDIGEDYYALIFR